MNIRPVRERSVERVRMGSARCFMLVLGFCMLSGCANEESLRKSKGFYQEGIAQLN